MGSSVQPTQLPIVEIGNVPEYFFTGIEIEVLANRCARFVLVCEQNPLGCEVGPENVVKVRCTTLVELVPGLGRKIAFALGKHWGMNVKGLMLPM